MAVAAIIPFLPAIPEALAVIAHASAAFAAVAIVRTPPEDNPFVPPGKTWTEPNGDVYKKVKQGEKVLIQTGPPNPPNQFPFRDLFGILAVAGTVVLSNFNKAEATPNQGDPLLLDLNGDGIKTTNFADGVLFDHDGNGFAEWSTWADASDGMLVMDKNGNGIIDNGTEIFGNSTVLSDGSKATDGYAALADLDSNHDGIIDANDTAFSNLQVLKGDGTLLSLQQAGIQSFNLAHTDTNITDVNGNTQLSLGSFVKTNGTTGQMGDYNLLTNTAISKPLTAVTVPTDIAALPDAMGSGNVYDLQQAMAMDTTGQLKGLVQAFIASTNVTQQNALLEQMLIQWSGVDPATVFSRSHMNAVQAAVVEKFEGHYFNGSPSSGITPIPGMYISQEYYELAESLYAELMAVTQLKDYFSVIEWAQNTTTQEYSLNITPVTQKIEQLATTDRAEALYVAAAFSRALNGLKWSLVSNYSDFYQAMGSLGSDFTFALDTADKQIIQGTSGYDDIGSNGLDGDWHNDVPTRDTRAMYLDGGAGDDSLLGSESSDILVGGAGNDTLKGYGGNDTYVFAPHFGQDTIVEGNPYITVGEAGYDTVQFTTGITANQLTFYEDASNSLIIKVQGTRDQITILNEFDPSQIGRQVENFVFADGTRYSAEQIYSLLQPNPAINVITGTDNSDVLISTSGNDYLYGGAGNDTYVFNEGFGQDIIDETYETSTTDVIQFGSNILASNAIFGGDANNNLIISFKNSADTVTINQQLNSTVIETFKFADGTTYTAAQVNTMLQILGTSGTDYLQGSNLAEKIYGYARADNLYGLGGNDTLDGGDGDDYLSGGDGNDSLIGGNGNDRLDGEAGNDTLDGGVGNDTLYGGDGNDTYLINTGFGQDLIADTSGTDILQFGPNLLTSNVIFTGSNNDLIVSFTGSSDQVTISNQLSNPDSQIETFKFADGTTYTAAQVNGLLQTLGTTSADYLAGSTLAEKMYGYAGDDNIYGWAGNDTLDGGDGNDYLSGGDDNDSLIGGNGDDRLDGELGNDTLDGGTGNDILYGGDGNDVYLINSGFGQDTIGDSSGTDTIQFGPNLLASNVIFTGSNSDLIVSFKGSSDQLTISAQLSNPDSQIETFKFADGTTYTAAQVNGLLQTLGTSAADTLYGSNLSESIYGYAGADNLYGFTGNDTIDGGDGDDHIEGGDGNDSLIGGNGNDYLSGDAGDDTLDGGTGNDLLLGGTGNDVYIVNNSAATITEYVNEGTDLVQASVTYALTTNVENLTLTGSTAINGTGNALNNIITGNIASNILDGGTGADSLKGGLGDDTYIVDNTGDLITENANEGTDTVQASVTYTLATNVENLTLTGSTAINGTGNALNNVLTGNSDNNSLTGAAGDDILNGAAGTDTLVGGTGNDTYIVDSTTDTITENANEGTDTVQSSVTYTLGNNLENLTLTGTIAINGTGNALNNLIVGNSANNILTGGAGDDILNGGAGADSLLGGLGNDTYIVDNGGDLITENANEGTDWVQASVTYTLATNVENLTLTGSTTINGTGNTLNNVLTGNSANNILDGSTGADSLLGGLGDDTYIVDNTGDLITENVNEGTDIVQASVTYTLATNVENLTLTGSTAINGTGNALNNVLTGNSGNNSLTGAAGDDILNGGAGTDTLLGGTGNDTYIVDSTTDTITENANEGTDTVQSSVTYTLGNNLENLTLTGTTAINGTGNSLNNVITGNSANNILDGSTGIDTLIGGAGNDTYIVDNAGDFVTENANEGTDLVQSSVSYTLGANIENLTLTGSSAINGTGNTLNNVLTGNATNNSLIGGAGDDTFNGGAGTDTLIGGIGNDTYIIDSTTDMITENINEGTDTVQSSVTYTLGNNLENLSLTGTTALNGTGNALNNLVTGNTANNVLTGGAGIDTLNGGTGNDILIGGTGNDFYLFKLGDGQDVVQENDTTAGNVDHVQFDSSIAKAKIAIFKNGNNLEIGYQGDTTDKIIVQNQSTAAGQVERFDLSTGQYMTNTDVNLVIQNMTSYATSHGISITSLSTVQNNQNLVNIVAAGWHS